LPPATGVAFTKEARDVLIECCVEFITLVSSEANDISEKEAKKTIACDHITKALEQLGFSDYVPAVLEAAAEHKEVQKVRLASCWYLDRTRAYHPAGPREEAQQVRFKWYDDGGTGEAAARAIRASSSKAYIEVPLGMWDLLSGGGAASYSAFAWR
jgi:hypothetical protein